METFQVHPHSLNWLLKTIHEGQLALPDFQRDFVWDARATEALIESISAEFPAGSLLFMPYRDKTFKPRAVQNAPELTGNPAKLILDGQQRLTSLYQAFFGVGESRYFINLQALIDGEDLEEAIFYRHHKRTGQFGTLQQQADRLVLPLGVIFGAHGGFDAWLDEVMDARTESGDDRRELKTRIRGAYERHVKTIETYQFPVVELGLTTPLEAVCSIFETLNKTGVKLTVFELLAARFYAQDLNLRELWESTLRDFRLVDDFHVDPYYILQSVALRKSGSTKRGDVLRLDRNDIEEHWQRVCHGYEESLRMLRDECGVLTPKWMPYQYLLVAMGACWNEAVAVPGPAAGANRQRLQRWFWCSSFSQTYEAAANSQAARDFAELRRWTEGGEAPQTVRDFSFDPNRLLDITPRQQSIYRAGMALILRNGALDFHRGRVLTAGAIAADDVDDHHVFPQAHLRDEGVAGAIVDSVVNRTMIDAVTNRRIGRRAPSDYLAEMDRDFTAAGSPDLLAQILESHLLPGESDSPLRSDDFPGFVERRRDLLARAIREVTGSVAAVDVDEGEEVGVA
jgi:hypothetical protein